MKKIILSSILIIIVIAFFFLPLVKRSCDNFTPIFDNTGKVIGNGAQPCHSYISIYKYISLNF